PSLYRLQSIFGALSFGDGSPRQNYQRLELYPKFPLLIRVHRQYPNGGSTDGCPGHNPRIVPLEMVLPSLSPWVEQRDHLLRLGIDPRQVRAFMQVAVVAGEGQI